MRDDVVRGAQRLLLLVIVGGVLIVAFTAWQAAAPAPGPPG